MRGLGSHRAGAFGAPTFFVDGAMLFGKDRLDFAAEAIGAGH